MMILKCNAEISVLEGTGIIKKAILALVYLLSSIE
jgi:hypothetical protein